MPLLVDKPLEYTSHDIVAIARRQLHVRRIGHAGTLDPLASGLLIVLVGRSETKLQAQYMEYPKEYIADITLGFYSTTDDAEGELTFVKDPSNLQLTVIEDVLRSFVGTILQRPPIYSAIKIAGKRAYSLARSQKIISSTELPSREVTIYDLQLEAVALPVIRIRVHCSKGTYIRSLARDIGQALGVGGYISDLRRTRIGEFSVGDAINIEQLKQLDPFRNPHI